MNYLYDNYKIVNFIIDGFPRNQDNLDSFKKAFGFANTKEGLDTQTLNERVNILTVIHLLTDESIIMSRLKNRAIEQQRNDDLDTKAIITRLNIWRTDTQAIID
mmetsp:Transcript_52471/g.43972  ORF Transcript_52471/g.43972 Transcript_52471/m.43972 type:complete len:104 (+) Transcript_52471:265-576(+)